MDSINLQDWIIFLATSFVSFFILFCCHWLLLARHKELTADQRLPRQLTMLIINIVAIIAIILSLPVSESLRNQLLALFGVLLSGIIAFSSTSIVSNLVAGLVLRLNQPFKAGDYIRCNGISGRVTAKGLLDTEVQTEARTLIHVANSFLVTHPVEVVRTSGTLISAQVSIGYDVHHGVIEQYLIQAAEAVELTDAFVHVTELGNYSINYKVSGLLLDTKSMITATSLLHSAILDELHNHDIEIMSPKMIAPREVDKDYTFIAKANTKLPTESVKAEEVAFDKAEEAEQSERKRTQIAQEITDLKAILSDDLDQVSIISSANSTPLEKPKTPEQKTSVEARINTLEKALIALEENKVDPDL